MSGLPNREKIWTPLFIGIILVALLTATSSQGVAAALTTYLTGIGRTSSFGGLLLTIFSLTAACGRLISGGLSDRYGRRVMLLAGSAVYAVGAALPLLFPAVDLLTLFRAIQGLGFAMVNTAAAAAAADVLPRTRLGEGLGYFGLVQSVALAIGPAIMLAAAAQGGAFGMFLLVTAMMAAALILSWFCRYTQQTVAPPRENSGEPFYRRLVEKRALMPASLEVIYSFGISCTLAFIAAYAESKSIARPGLFFTVSAVSMVLMRLTAGRLIDRFAPLPILIATQAFSMLSFVLIIACRGAAVYYLAGIMYGFGFGLSLPLLSCIAVRRSDKRRVGAANATFYLGMDTGFILGATVWGLIIDRWGYAPAFGGAGLLMVLIAVLGCFALRRESAPAEQPPAA